MNETICAHCHLPEGHESWCETVKRDPSVFREMLGPHNARLNSEPCPDKVGPHGPTECEPRNKGGRPKGFSGIHSKMPSALAQAFMRAGLDWRVDFALAIKANKRERIKLWLKLLPYMITTSSRAKVRRWKGRPSKAAMIALETLEDR